MTTTRTAPYWEQLNSMVGEDRRKERRIPIAFPVEVNGFDRHGKFFGEQTVTRDVSEWGCRMQLAADVEPGAVVALRITTRSTRDGVRRALLFQVIWVEQAGSSFLVGAAKLQAENLWHMDFPKRAAEKTAPGKEPFET